MVVGYRLVVWLLRFLWITARHATVGCRGQTERPPQQKKRQPRLLHSAKRHDSHTRFLPVLSSPLVPCCPATRKQSKDGRQGPWPKSEGSSARTVLQEETHKRELGKPGLGHSPRPPQPQQSLHSVHPYFLAFEGLGVWLLGVASPVRLVPSKFPLAVAWSLALAPVCFFLPAPPSCLRLLRVRTNRSKS